MSDMLSTAVSGLLAFQQVMHRQGLRPGVWYRG